MTGLKVRLSHKTVIRPRYEHIVIILSLIGMDAYEQIILIIISLDFWTSVHDFQRCRTPWNKSRTYIDESHSLQ